jgi:hypothetical protein
MKEIDREILPTSHDFGVSHSYEEIRAAAFEVLSGRFKSTFGAGQFINFRISVAEALLARSGTPRHPGSFGNQAELDYQEAEIFLEVFWDLFRQGITTLGSDNANPNFPFFRLTALGRKIVEAEGGHLVLDPQGGEERLQAEVPGIDGCTGTYFKEALQSFRVGGILAATTMLGVAAEHTANLLIAKVETSEAHKAKFAAINKVAGLEAKLQKFRDLVDQHPEILATEVRDGFDVKLAGLQMTIGIFKNDAGVPTGKEVSREEAFVLLLAFPQYCKKAHQVMACF